MLVRPKDAAFSVLLAMSMRPKKGPSYVAKKGNVEVPVYTIKRGQPNEHHVVCYYEGGRRQRRCFSDQEKAKAEANRVAEKISMGDLEAVRLTGLDRQCYLAAMEHLRPTGTTLECATREYAAAVTMLKGNPLLEAVRSYVQLRQGPFSPKKVPEVVAELLAQKENKGRSEVYTRDLRYRLNRFAADFNDSDVHEVTTSKIEGWLHKLKLSPRSKNNFLTSIRTLFTLATTRHYIPTGHPGASEIEQATESPHAVEIFTPQEMLRVLHHARPEMVPFLALGAFGGVRSAEIQRLTWTDVKWNQGVIEIASGKAKTRARRLVPLNECLRAWLEPHCRKAGPIMPFANVVNQIKTLAEDVDRAWKQENALAAFVWKSNGLRHSYVSYRLAQTGNENQVAQECGNSPAMIFKHYRALVTKDDAERWFAIRPVTEANVVPMVQPAVQ